MLAGSAGYKGACLHNMVQLPGIQSNLHILLSVHMSLLACRTMQTVPCSAKCEALLQWPLSCGCCLPAGVCCSSQGSAAGHPLLNVFV